MISFYFSPKLGTLRFNQIFLCSTMAAKTLVQEREPEVCWLGNGRELRERER